MNRGKTTNHETQMAPADLAPFATPRVTDVRGRRLRSWATLAAAASIGAVAAAVVPAIAAPTITPVTFHACVTNATGTIRLVSAKTKCKATEHKISWNSVGPKGPAGPAGKTGPKGPPGVVEAVGTNAPSVMLPASENGTIATLKAPKGDFVVAAKVDAVIGHSAAADTLSCAMVDGTGTDDISSALLKLTDTDNLGFMTFVGVTTVGGPITIQCHETNGDATPEATFDTHAWAIPVNHLNGINGG